MVLERRYCPCSHLPICCQPVSKIVQVEVVTLVIPIALEAESSLPETVTLVIPVVLETVNSLLETVTSVQQRIRYQGSKDLGFQIDFYCFG